MGQHQLRLLMDPGEMLAVEAEEEVRQLLPRSQSCGKGTIERQRRGRGAGGAVATLITGMHTPQTDGRWWHS